MCSFATTDHAAPSAAPAPVVARLQADLAAVRAELATVRTERHQLRGALADLLAAQVQLRAQLAAAQAQLAAVELKRQETRQELVDLKRQPFVARRSTTSDTPTKPRGRPVGHPGAGRSRPTRIDRTQRIGAGDTCPDCGTPFSGLGATRERVVEDIELVRPTVQDVIAERIIGRIERFAGHRTLLAA